MCRTIVVSFLQIITKTVQFMQGIRIGKYFLINWKRGIYSKKMYARITSKITKNAKE